VTSTLVQGSTATKRLKNTALGLTSVTDVDVYNKRTALRLLVVLSGQPSQKEWEEEKCMLHIEWSKASSRTIISSHEIKMQCSIVYLCNLG